MGNYRAQQSASGIARGRDGWVGTFMGYGMQHGINLPFAVNHLRVTSDSEPSRGGYPPKAMTAEVRVRSEPEPDLADAAAWYE